MPRSAGTRVTPARPPTPTPPVAGTPVTPVTSPTPPTAPTPAPVRPTHPLTGRGTGTFQATRVNPDVGAEFKFQGTAQMAALGGPVAVAGDLKTPGNIADAVTTGTLTVSTKAGSVTVALTSFRPPVAVGAPIWYRYRVTAGTGSFVGLHDTGSLRLDCVPAPTPRPLLTRDCARLAHAGSAGAVAVRHRPVVADDFDRYGNQSGARSDNSPGGHDFGDDRNPGSRAGPTRSGDRSARHVPADRLSQPVESAL